MSGPLATLGRQAHHHRLLVIGLWLALALGLGIFAPKLEHALSGAMWEVNGSDSLAARQVLEEKFGGFSSQSAVVVLNSDSRRNAFHFLIDGEHKSASVGILDEFLPDTVNTKGSTVATLDLGPAFSRTLEFRRQFDGAVNYLAATLAPNELDPVFTALVAEHRGAGGKEWSARAPRRPAFVGGRAGAHFETRNGRVWIDGEAWRTKAPAIIARAGGLLRDDNGRPALAVKAGDFAAKDSEMIACEVECRRDGIGGVFVALDVPGLDEAIAAMKGAR